MADSPYISLNDAAKLTGRAKSTISKALKKGTMSYISKDSKTGAYEIDPAEAERVFPPKQETSKSYYVENTRNPTENSILQVKLEASNQRFDDAQATIEDLRARLDKSEAARERQDMLLADMREIAPQPQKRGLWARLVG
jgi:hypothetical protein